MSIQVFETLDLKKTETIQEMLNGVFRQKSALGKAHLGRGSVSGVLVMLTQWVIYSHPANESDIRHQSEITEDSSNL